MAESMPREQIETLVNQILKGELSKFELPQGDTRPPIRVVPVKTTEGRRPDGLREDAPENPGFSFAVAEGLIELNRTRVSDAQFEQMHRILWEAGTDDFMDYSQLNQFEATAVPADATVALSFSSAGKAASVIVKLLANLA